MFMIRMLFAEYQLNCQGTVSISIINSLLAGQIWNLDIYLPSLIAQQQNKTYLIKLNANIP